MARYRIGSQDYRVRYSRERLFVRRDGVARELAYRVDHDRRLLVVSAAVPLAWRRHVVGLAAYRAVATCPTFCPGLPAHPVLRRRKWLARVSGCFTCGVVAWPWW